MANLIVVCGPQAVGKMVVAESLRDKLKYNMMINHDSIEISDKIFGFATQAQREFNRFFREKAFELAVKYDVDLLFTYVCAFEMPAEREYLTQLADLFVSGGGNFYFVELCADLETRLERNVSPYRMERKVSKRDVRWSRDNLLQDTEKHRLNSNEGEVWFENHIKIDNTNLEPDKVADMVIQRFRLKANEKEEGEYRFGVPQRASGEMPLYDNGDILVRMLCEDDIPVIVEEERKQGWLNSAAEKFEMRLRHRHELGAIPLVAEFKGNIAGYINVYPNSKWGSFANCGYCEIVDFAVLEKYRKAGVGGKLMDVAEQLAAGYSDTVYLGVGLHSGYGSAQRMYVKRGYIPDGKGVWYGADVCQQYGECRNDDDLNLYLSKKLR